MFVGRSVLVPLLAGCLLLFGCNSSSTEDEGRNSRICTEPENPYDEGSGHHAGFEWASEKILLLVADHPRISYVNMSSAM